MKNQGYWFVIMVIAASLAGCESGGDEKPAKIQGVDCTIRHLGKVIIGPTIISDYNLGLYVQKDDDTITHFGLTDSYHYHNLFAIEVGSALYRVRFLENEHNPNKDTITHILFFTSYPTPQQIAAFIPEELKKADTPTPKPTVMRPEKEPGK